MKTIEEIHRYIQSAMAEDRQTHEYRAEGASLEFTEKMLAQMENTGVSRSELARRIGVKPSYITKILRGDTNFTLDTMVKIANALGCEYRSHFQPDGAKTQWFDVLSKKVHESFRATGQDAQNVIHGTFRKMDWRALQQEAL